jgi:cytochrome P450
LDLATPDAPHTGRLINLTITERNMATAVADGNAKVETINGTPPVPRPQHVPPDRVVDVDIYALPGGSENYHAAWKAVQNSGIPEIVWTPRNGGHWLATSGRLISHVFADYQRFSSRVIFVPKEIGQHHQLLPSTLDPPIHRSFRNTLNGGLSPRAIHRMEEPIARLAAELVQSFRARGSCDFNREFAEQLPIRIFMALVDLPVEHAKRIKYLSDQTTRPDGTMSYPEAIQAMIDYVRPIAESRRGSDGGDLISQVVNSRIGDRPITEKEASELCAQVLIGGVDTVVKMLGFFFLHLAQNAADRAALAADPALVSNAVEELLRRFPIVNDGREIVEDMVFEGVTMKKGEMIVMPTPLHGLDDRENENAMKVDFRRSTCRHSTFGNGAHKCPGANLARTELKIALREWLKRIPDFSLASDLKLSFTCGVGGSVDELHLVWDVDRTHDVAVPST